MNKIEKKQKLVASIIISSGRVQDCLQGAAQATQEGLHPIKITTKETQNMGSIGGYMVSGGVRTPCTHPLDPALCYLCSSSRVVCKNP